LCLPDGCHTANADPMDETCTVSVDTNGGLVNEYGALGK